VSTDRDRARFLEKVTGYIAAAMPGATFLALDPVIGEDSVSLSGYDENDARPAAEIVAALDAALRADGWRTVRSGDGATEGLNVAKDGVGGGVFGVQAMVVSFTGVPGYGAAEAGSAHGAARPPARDDSAPAAERRRTLSREIRAAIRSATPHAVHPRDDFEDAEVRVAGWDPDERQSDEELLARAGTFLTANGWRVSPDPWTDSSDRSAAVSKEGLASGRLQAANGGLTFIGRLTG
jgi:hypothetical protein